MNRKIAFGFILLCGLFAFLDGKAQPKIGDKAPDILLKDSSGNPVRLHELDSKLILIDFWASWCGPCRKSNRELFSVYKKFHPKGFEIYGISLDQSGADWRRAIINDKIQWLQVIDKGGWDAKVATDWKIEYLPTSFLINENKEVIAINPGRPQLERFLKKLKK